MKIKEIIEHLKTNYDENDSVVIAWWDRESFDPDLVNNPSLNWELACYRMDDINWHDTHDKITDVLQTWVKG
jgi:hypothetical protein